MDAAIADTINRRDAWLLALHLDDTGTTFDGGKHWHLGIEASAFLSTTCSSGEKAWLFSALAANVPGLHFDGDPADCDWENLFSHFRAEILARRAPGTHCARVTEHVRSGVGSR
jgi:hypothetical protein